MGMNISDFFDMDVLIHWLERFLYEIHKRNKGRITPMCKM